MLQSTKELNLTFSAGIKRKAGLFTFLFSLQALALKITISANSMDIVLIDRYFLSGIKKRFILKHSYD